MVEPSLLLQSGHRSHPLWSGTAIAGNLRSKPRRFARPDDCDRWAVQRRAALAATACAFGMQRSCCRALRVKRRGTQPWQPWLADVELRPEEQHGWHAIGIFRGKSELNHGTLWRSAYQMGAAFIFTVGARHSGGVSIGNTDTTQAWARLPYFRFDSFDDLLGSQPEASPIVAVEMGGEPLETFRHPPRAIYLLGAEDDGLPPKVIERCQYHVSLPAVRSASMNVAAVGGVLLYDRLLKRMLLDPFPHAPHAKKPARRLAAAVAAHERMTSFAAAKQSHLESGRVVSMYAQAAQSPPLSQLIVLLNRDTQPFFVTTATPARVVTLPWGTSLFEPAELRVRCLDLRAAHALIGIAAGGKCCVPAATMLDEGNVTVELRTRAPAFEVQAGPSPLRWLRAVSQRLRRCVAPQASGRGADALDLEQENFAETRLEAAEKELNVLVSRIEQARPGWASTSGRSAEPRSYDDVLADEAASRL